MRNIPAQGEQDLQQIDKRTWAQPEDTTTGGDTPPFSSSYDSDDYSLGPSTSKHSEGSSYEDEELDLFLEDIRQAQSIREAAQTKDANSAIPSAGNSVPPQGMPDITDLSSTQGDVDDPFIYLTDEETSNLPEQHASVSIHEPDEGVHDIADVPTNVLHIEDMGDTDEGFNQHPGAPGLDLSEDTTDEEQDIPGPSRVHGVRPRTNRTGGMQRPQPPRPNSGSEDVMAPPPVYDQRTRAQQRKSGPMPVKGNQPASYPVMGGGNRSPQAVPLPPARPAQAKAPQTRPQPGGSPTGKGARPAPKTQAPAPRTTQPKKQGKKGRGNVGLGVTALVSVLVLLFIGLWAYLGPSADVTLTLQSHNYPLPLKLTANTTSHMDVLHNTVPAQTLTYVTSATLPGHASGTATVGTVQATGTVTFTNNGTSSLVIPNGTIVSTKDGVQFVTQAEVLVLSGSSNTNLAPVQAKKAGTTGNVPAGSITVIPQEGGLNMIQQANPSNATVNVAVNNTDLTKGGGAGTAPSVADKDVKALQQQLDIQLQANVDAYIKKNVGPNDQRGKIVQVEPAPTVIPPVGNIVASGNFTMTLTRHITVLVVRYATIETASIEQIDATLNKQGNGLALVPQQPAQITKMANKSPNDGNSVALNYTAVGQVAPKISDDTVRQMVSGKSRSDAERALIGTSGIPDAANARVTTSPSWAWVTFYTPRINVHYNAVPAPSKKK
jgi:hypothetical protein